MLVISLSCRAIFLRLLSGLDICASCVTRRHCADAGSDLGKIIGIIAIGMPASLLFTAQVAVSIRRMVNTKLEDTPAPKKPPPFKAFHYSLWGASYPTEPIELSCASCKT